MKQADVLIVGAGAAGLLASISAGRQSRGRLRIALLDSRTKIGAKILISGGTRCNVTNRSVTPADYWGGPPHFVRHVLEAFSPAQTISFFSEIGVPLVLEPSGKYFPETHSGRTVLDALVRESARAGAQLVTQARVVGISRSADLFEVETESAGTWKAKRVILATGGLSLPETGSDGMGISLAKKMGHPLVSTFPALTPLTSNDTDWTELSGIALPARLSFFLDGKKKAQAHGSFLFTHFGYSGPAALDLSRHWAAAPERARRRVEASFIPSEDEESLRTHFLKDRSSQAILHFLMNRYTMPERFVDVLLKKARVSGRVVLSRLSSDDREKLIQALMHTDLHVTGVFGFKKAEATAGGVGLQGVRQATMESRQVAGLYFCGEILDVDGRIGGFNFQWAWSSGWIAGRAAAKALE